MSGGIEKCQKERELRKEKAEKMQKNNERIKARDDSKVHAVRV